MDNTSEVWDVADTVSGEAVIGGPNEFFENLKKHMSEIQKSELEKNQHFLLNQYTQAVAIGQKTFSDTLAFLWDVIEREIVAVSMGYNRVIALEKVIEYIDKVTPKNSVKSCELSKYPRMIPEANSKEIQRAKDSGIFDEIVILYTDFTDKNPNTPAQRAFVAKHRDPIAFGMFKNDKLDNQHERLYVITDWEDEHCDLTFSKLISRMNLLKIDPGETRIDKIDGAYLSKKIKAHVKEVNTVDLKVFKPKTTSFMSKIKGLIGL